MEGYWVTEMHRYGNEEGHSYVLGIFKSRKQAIIAGMHNYLYRGNKYTPSVDYHEVDDCDWKEELKNDFEWTKFIPFRSLDIEDYESLIEKDSAFTKGLKKEIVSRITEEIKIWKSILDSEKKKKHIEMAEERIKYYKDKLKMHGGNSVDKIRDAFVFLENKNVKVSRIEMNRITLGKLSNDLDVNIEEKGLYGAEFVENEDLVDSEIKLMSVKGEFSTTVEV